MSTASTSVRRRATILLCAVCCLSPALIFAQVRERPGVPRQPGRPNVKRPQPGRGQAAWPQDPQRRQLLRKLMDAAQRQQLDARRPMLIFPGSGAGPVAFSPDGRRLASGHGVPLRWEHNRPGVVAKKDISIKLWDAQTGQLLRSLQGHSDRVSGVAFSPDGARLVSGSFDKTVRLWDVETGQLLRTLPAGPGRVLSVAFAPDGRRLAAAGAQAPVRIWDAETGRPLQVLRGHSPWVSSVTFSPDGKCLASGGADRTVKLWDLATGRMRHTLTGHSAPVTCIAFSPGGSVLASGSADKTIRLWDVDAGRLLRTVDAYADQVLCVAFGPDGGSLASGGRDGALSLWSCETGQLIRPIQKRRPNRSGRPNPVLSLDFDPGGDRLAAGAGDGTLALYSVSDGRLLARLVGLMTARPEAPDLWLAITPEGYYDGTTDAARLITWFMGGGLHPVGAYERKYRRPDLVRQALSGDALTDVPSLTEDQVPPAATILTPEPDLQVEDGQVTVTVLATAAQDLTALELYVDGRPALEATERAIALEAKGIVLEAKDLPPGHTVFKEFRRRVLLPAGQRQVRIQAEAIDRQGLRSPRVAVIVRQKVSAPVKADLHVLALGVSNYANPAYNLRFAAADARAIATALEKQAPALYANVHTTVLVDEQATASALESAMQRVMQAVRLEDAAIVFVSAHGVRDEAHNYYLATHETDLADLGRTAFSWEGFRSLVADLRANRVLVLLDTCHAGGALGDVAASNPSLAERLAARAGAMVLASSGAAERSYERPDWQHGAFTKALLEALDGQAGRELDPLTLAAWIVRRVPELTADHQHPYPLLLTEFRLDLPLLYGGL